MNFALGSSGIRMVVPWLAVFGFLLLLLFGRSLLVGQPGLAPADLAIAAAGATLASILPWIASYVAMRRFRRGMRAETSGSTETFASHASGGMDRFDTFTDDGRKVLTLAQEEGQRFNHHYIGTEHLLLGLLRVPESVAARVLANMNVDLSNVRMAVEFIIGRGGANPGEVGLTPRAKRVIELAIDESRVLGHAYIGTEHLLLGLVREGEGIAAGVLESLGVNLDRVREEVLAELKRDTS
jgi:hypothetical protein